MLRQTQALTWGLLHKGCNHGLGPTHRARASQSCLSCILNKLGHLQDTAGVWAIPAGMQLTQSAPACWAVHRPSWGCSRDNDPEGRASFATFSRSINSYTHPEEVSASSKKITGAEVGEVSEKSLFQFVLPTAPPKLGSWWAKGIHRAELILRKKNNKQDTRLPTPNLWKVSFMGSYKSKDDSFITLMKFQASLLFSLGYRWTGRTQVTPCNIWEMLCSVTEHLPLAELV